MPTTRKQKKARKSRGLVKITSMIQEETEVSIELPLGGRKVLPVVIW